MTRNDVLYEIERLLEFYDIKLMELTMEGNSIVIAFDI